MNIIIYAESHLNYVHVTSGVQLLLAPVVSIILFSIPDTVFCPRYLEWWLDSNLHLDPVYT